jgi:hypothetical protein
MKTALFSLSLLVAIAPIAAAQDPFEIQVYEYVTVPKGKWDLETHVNRVLMGEMKGQNHLTFEFTRGITDMFELAGYLVTASRPGVNGEFAGWRVRPRWRLPEDMLPVKLSLALEFGFPKAVYEPAKTTLEIRPIIEKAWGDWQLDLNPVVGKSIRGPGSDEGFDFEPGVRLGYTVNPKYDLSLEYYGSTGEVTNPLPSAQQVHQIFPGADINVTPDIVLNVGFGFGLTDAGNTRVLKTRLGWIF